jgi:hypothetical protein
MLSEEPEQISITTQIPIKLKKWQERHIMYTIGQCKEFAGKLSVLQWSGLTSPKQAHKSNMTLMTWTTLLVFCVIQYLSFMTGGYPAASK